MIKYKLTYVSLVLATFVLVLSGKPSYGDAIQISVYPLISQVTTNSATISLNGKIYSENIWLEDVSAGKIQVAPDESFIARVLVANQSGSAADVLNTWNPDERIQMGTYINNPDLFSANQNWNKTIKYSALLAKISFGEFTVFVVQHTMQDSTNIAKLYPILSVNGSYYMTNLLSNDPMFTTYMVKAKDLVAFKVKTQ